MTKKIRIIAIILCAVVAATTTIIILSDVNRKAPVTMSTSSVKTVADNLKKQAIQAYGNNQPETAKKLLEEARAKYLSIKDTVDLADVDSLLSFVKIQNDKTTKPVTFVTLTP